MTNTVALLDKAKKLCSPETDYQLAKRLGISSSTIYRCRHHNGTLDNKAVVKLAKFIGQDFQSILALVELDRAKRDEDRIFWEHIAPRVLPSLVIAALAAVAGGTPEYVHGAAVLTYLPNQSVYYAQYVLLALILAAVAHQLARTIKPTCLRRFTAAA